MALTEDRLSPQLDLQSVRVGIDLRDGFLQVSPDPEIPRSTWSWLVPRLISDVLAVGAGLLVYDAIVRRIEFTQALVGLVFVALAAIIDITHVRREWSRIEEFVLAIKVGTTTLALTTAVTFLVDARASRITFLSAAGALIVLRPILVFRLGTLDRRSRQSRTVVAICNDLEYRLLLDAIAERAVAPLRVVARAGGEGPLQTLNPVRSTGEVAEIVELCRKHRPWRLVVGSNELPQREFVESLLALNEDGIAIRSLPAFFEEEFGRVPLTTLDSSWFLFDIGPMHNIGYRAARYLFDLAAGALVGITCLLLAPLIAVAIRVESPGPVLYRQKRVGQRGALFEIVKFRTMRADAEASGPQWALARDCRITRVGRFLRKSRLDELPQFINLLRGEMSLIGPRPERPEFIETLVADVPFFDKRQLIRPGLTGWAQVHEGYGASVSEMVRKLERDLFYLKHQSLGLDLRIVAATVSNVVRLQGR